MLPSNITNNTATRHLTMGQPDNQVHPNPSSAASRRDSLRFQLPVLVGLIEHKELTPRDVLLYLLTESYSWFNLNTSGCYKTQCPASTYADALGIDNLRLIYASQRRLEAASFFDIKRTRFKNRNNCNQIIPTLNEATTTNVQKTKRQFGATAQVEDNTRLGLLQSRLYCLIDKNNFFEVLKDKTLSDFEKVLWVFCSLKNFIHAFAHQEDTFLQISLKSAGSLFNRSERATLNALKHLAAHNKLKLERVIQNEDNLNGRRKARVLYRIRTDIVAVNPSKERPVTPVPQGIVRNETITCSQNAPLPLINNTLKEKTSLFNITSRDVDSITSTDDEVVLKTQDENLSSQEASPEDDTQVSLNDEQTTLVNDLKAKLAHDREAFKALPLSVMTTSLKTRHRDAIAVLAPLAKNIYDALMKDFKKLKQQHAPTKALTLAKQAYNDAQLFLFDELSKGHQGVLFDAAKKKRIKPKAKDGKAFLTQLNRKLDQHKLDQKEKHMDVVDPYEALPEALKKLLNESLDIYVERNGYSGSISLYELKSQVAYYLTHVFEPQKALQNNGFETRFRYGLKLVVRLIKQGRFNCPHGFIAHRESVLLGQKIELQ